jgi:Xaa-Pro aminopeptidase
VHDSGNSDLPFKEGVVITVEPGIYIPEEGIGIRIEDVIQVTKGGP